MSEIKGYVDKNKTLVIDLFEKHNELGPNILRYVKNSLLTNLHLNQIFIRILKSSSGEVNFELEKEDCVFVYERCVSIYMKSRQKTWRNVNNYIPEKGTASLRESLKVMNYNRPTTALNDNKKPTIMKKRIYHPTLLMLWNNFVYGHSLRKQKSHL